MVKNKLFSYSLIILGILFISVSPVFTGASISENLIKVINSFLGIFFVIGGIVLFLVNESREKRSKLVIMVSGKALKKLNKDKVIREQKNWVFNEIKRISQDPSMRPQEIIGEFHVSPRGNSPHGMRLAWYFDSMNNILNIYDLLYHTAQGKYVGNWNKKVRKGEIKKNDYGELRPYENVA